MRKRVLALLIVLGVGAAGLVWWWSFAEPAVELNAQAKAAPTNVAQEKSIAAVPPRAALGDPKGDAFAPRQWAAEAPAVSVPQAAAPPSPPAMPYRYAGKVVREGTEEILLANGDVLLPVRVGEKLEGGYRVESIAAGWIVLLHQASGTRQRIEMNSLLEPGAKR